MNHQTLRRISAFLGIALVVAGAMQLGLAHEKKGTEKKTFVGHVVDLACYVGHGSIGDSHRDCATTCAKAGIPLALLDQETHTLYLPLAKDHHTPANADLMPFVEKDVRVTGTVVEKDGMKAILLDSLAGVQ